MPKKQKAPEVLYRCSAADYKGDRPHYWEPMENGDARYYHASEGEKPKHSRKTCPDHVPPTFHTAESLASGLGPAFPEFGVTTEEDSWYGGQGKVVYPVVKLTGDGIEIRIVFFDSGDLKKLNSYDSAASGHTSFSTSQGTRTFDRTGVEDSFYVRYNDNLEAVIATIKGQIKRVAESRARISNMAPIPGLGWLVTPAGKDEIAAKLQAGKSHEFRPSGFGTGYRVYRRSVPASRFDKRAEASTEQFFGVSPLWLQQLDCD